MKCIYEPIDFLSLLGPLLFHVLSSQSYQLMQCVILYIKNSQTILLNKAMWIIIWKPGSERWEKMKKKKTYKETLVQTRWKLAEKKDSQERGVEWQAERCFESSSIRGSTRGAGNRNAERDGRKINALWRALQLQDLFPGVCKVSDSYAAVLANLWD